MTQDGKLIQLYVNPDKTSKQSGRNRVQEESKRDNLLDAHAKGNPKVDGKIVRGYN